MSAVGHHDAKEVERLLPSPICPSLIPILRSVLAPAASSFVIPRMTLPVSSSVASKASDSMQIWREV